MRREGWRAFAPRRAGRDLPLDAAPRRATPSKRSGCLLPHRNPYASGGLLLRARLDRGPFTPPPQRHCSRTRAPFSPFLRRLALTSEAPEPARPTEPWEPEPPSIRPAAAPDTASTTESARGLMCRELHEAFLVRNGFAINKKNGAKQSFFLPRAAHRVVHSLSTYPGLFPSISSAFEACSAWGETRDACVCSH